MIAIFSKYINSKRFKESEPPKNRIKKFSLTKLFPYKIFNLSKTRIFLVHKETCIKKPKFYCGSSIFFSQKKKEFNFSCLLLPFLSVFLFYVGATLNKMNVVSDIYLSSVLFVSHKAKKKN
jgi:hypothetical protein